MIPVVECEGAPRDLGRDQGAVCRDELRARFARGSRFSRWRSWLGRVDAEARWLERDLWRHFPHQAEYLRGLGVGAGVPSAWLVSELVRLRADPVRAVALETPKARLARGLSGRFLVRRSRPEGLFASVDVALPGVAAPLLGVNARGLGVAVLPARIEREAAPAWFLGRDCLERFEEVEPALDWCQRRPGAAGGGLLFAEAGGAVAGVRFEAEPRVLRPSDGRIVETSKQDAESLASALAPAELAALAELVDGAAVDVAERVLWVGGERFSP